VGEVSGKVEGSARLLDQNFIEGSVTNGTGKLLRNVYIAFSYPVQGGLGGDYLLYLPVWEPGITLDLNREFMRAGEDGKPTPTVGINGTPDEGKRVRGKIDVNWFPYWEQKLKPRMMETRFDDHLDRVRRSFPVMSFFERLPPTKNPGNKNERVELLRRGARHLDVSHLLAAGALVVLAESAEPMPVPLEVEGSLVGGTGTTLYQFLLPLDRSRLIAPDEDEDQGATTAPALNAEENQRRAK
jgi:hypothetical protein